MEQRPRCGRQRHRSSTAWAGVYLEDCEIAVSARRGRLHVAGVAVVGERPRSGGTAVGRCPPSGPGSMPSTGDPPELRCPYPCAQTAKAARTHEAPSRPGVPYREALVRTMGPTTREPAHDGTQRRHTTSHWPRRTSTYAAGWRRSTSARSGRVSRRPSCSRSVGGPAAGRPQLTPPAVIDELVSKASPG